MAPGGKTGKNLDFKVRPDGRDILIEVTTPRMRLETELMYSDTPHAGFFDPSRGIEREGYAGPSRAQVVVESKVINQILEVASGTDYPVILIINHTYAYPEIMMGFGEDVSGRIRHHPLPKWHIRIPPTEPGYCRGGLHPGFCSSTCDSGSRDRPVKPSTPEEWRSNTGRESFGPPRLRSQKY